MKPSTKMRVIWAVDPFAEDVELQKQTGDVASLLGLEVEATCIIPVGFDKVWTEARMRELAPNWRHTLLQHEDMTLSTAVRQLVLHGLAVDAGLIITGTLARRGATHFLLGSFTECLILQSPIPTLVVSPKVQVPRAFQRILFPTNLGELSRKVFPKALDLGRQLGIPIRIFHQVAATLDRDQAEKIASDWASVAVESGISADWEVSDEKTTLKDSILRRAVEGDIIAVVSDGSPGHVRTLGSVTRQIIDQSNHPVWVLHTEDHSR